MGILLVGRLPGYNTESLTIDHIVGNVFGEFHATCLLNTSFVDFEKDYRHIVAASKD